MAEFAGNNTVSETTKVTPFFANKGFHPRMGFEELPPSQTPQHIAADSFVDHMKELNDLLRTEMAFAQANHETAANRHCVPAPAYQVGDEVWLNTKNLHTKCPCRKLEARKAGPFKIKRIVSPHAYELNLPTGIDVHPVFHVNLLDPVAQDAHPGHMQIPPPPIIVDGEEEHEVEKILDSRFICRSLKYLVKWIGYDNPTWEPPAFITHAQDLLEEFHQQYPNKPRPR